MTLREFLRGTDAGGWFFIGYCLADAAGIALVIWLWWPKIIQHL
jgi:hypothetical protein